MITLFASNELDLNKTSSAVAEMGDRLATIYMRQKGGVGQRAPYHRELCRECQDYPESSDILIHPAVWQQQTWPKTGGCAPFLVGMSWVPI